MSLFLIGCGDDDNSNDKPKDPKDEYKIGVTAQYLYSLIGTSYDQLKSSDIGEVKEESAINDNYDKQIVFLCFCLKNNIIYL